METSVTLSARVIRYIYVSSYIFMCHPIYLCVILYLMSFVFTLNEYLAAGILFYILNN